MTSSRTPTQKQDGAIVAGDPEFGERVEPAPTNPARKTAPKKTDD